MPAVRLPADVYYVSVEHAVLGAAMERIEEQFLDLLENGTQAQGLPNGCYAAGQYMNPYSINHRGLHGTAAALLVLSRSPPSQDRIKLIEGLIKYIGERSEVEHTLTDSDSDRSMLTARLATEWDNTFKCADLLYALSAAPPAVSGRESLLRDLLARIQKGHRPDGGWAVRLDPAGRADPLATASVVRALNAAGVSLAQADVDLLEESVNDVRGVSVHVRLFCFLVLLEIPGRDPEPDELWKRMVDELSPQLRERAETNHQFTIGNQYQYVGIPWQLHLLSCTAVRSPFRAFFGGDTRRVLLDAIVAVNSREGYVYGSQGHMRSTRTYGILMDTLWKLDQVVVSSRYLSSLSTLANWGVRVVYSRVTAGLALLGALALGAFTLWSWIVDEKIPMAAVGSNLFASGLLGIIALLLRHMKRR
ncbi:hypothetical protein [Streptosporangium sp. NPDC051022]|uniref:hypothetical protein n=1 Tax=Streptosporangium sp. NPDC051022 TaxID=3155752 RepID=UPI00343FC994